MSKTFFCFFKNTCNNEDYLLCFFPDSVCCCSVARSCLTICNLMDCSILGSSVPHHLLVKFELLKLMSVFSVMPSNHLISSHLILCCPLFLLPSVFACFRIFSNESVLHIKWSFSFNINSCNVYSELIAFRIDWLDLLACKGLSRVFFFPTPQFKSINSSALSFLYGPTVTSKHDYWKNHSFDYRDHCWQSDISAFECAI